MIKMKKNILILIYILVFFVNFALLDINSYAEVEKNTTYSEPLVLENENGESFKFIVEVVSDDLSRQKGLMFRDKMARNEGMLFNFETEKHVTFWMHNTYISLDLLFINSDGIVVNIFEGAVPMSKKPIPSKEKVKAVLEINSGMLKVFSVGIGSVVRHKIFSNY